MTTNNFLALKEKIISSDSFSDVFDYFFAHFAEETAFYDLGKPSQNQLLPEVLKMVSQKYFGKKTKLSNYRMTEIGDNHFIHGTCFMDDKLALVIYFSDIQMGISSISMGNALYNFVHLKATELETGQGYSFVNREDSTLN